MSDNRNVSRQQFGQHAEEYRLSRTHGDQATLDRLIQLIAPEAGKKAADVGCGGGHMAVSLAKHVKELIAIDLTPQMLTQTNILASQRKLSNIISCLADAQNLPFKPEEFDIVSCRTVLHHVPNVSKAVSEMGRVLRKGGKLFISDMVGFEDRIANSYMDEIERLRDPSHFKCYSLEEWQRFFEVARCKITHMNVISRRSRNLKEWTDRSGTPRDKVETIVKMLQNVPEDVSKYFQVEYVDGDYILNAKSAQFLGIKE
jgi:ubiquinone/menaquinone biosynthesis C-methylase UbiE